MLYYSIVKERSLHASSLGEDDDYEYLVSLQLIVEKISPQKHSYVCMKHHKGTKLISSGLRAHSPREVSLSSSEEFS